MAPSTTETIDAPQQPAAKLMCPWFVHDPEAHQEASCKNSRYPNMSRLRQHIDRVHIYAPECGCCPDAVKKSECADTIKFLAGICLKSAPYHNQPRRIKWQIFFHEIFPNHLPIPSPYEEHSLTLDEEKTLLSLLAQRLNITPSEMETIYFECRRLVHQSTAREDSAEPSGRSVISVATSGSSDIPPSSHRERDIEISKRRRTSRTASGVAQLTMLSSSRSSSNYTPSTASSSQGSSQHTTSSQDSSHASILPCQQAPRLPSEQVTSNLPPIYPTPSTMGYSPWPQYATAYPPHTNTHPQILPYTVMPGAGHVHPGFAPQTPPNPNPFSDQFTTPNTWNPHNEWT